MRSTHPNTSRIVLVLNPSLTFHREIIAGVGAFSQSAGLKWVFEIETNVLKALAAAQVPAPAGFIVDSEAVEEVELLASMGSYPLVCISSAVSSPCPARVSLIASDNAALIEQAIRHLRDSGLTSFAFYAKPKYSRARWAKERLSAFSLQIDSPISVLFDSEGEEGALAGQFALLEWIRRLPQRTGIVAVNDSSAREVLHACNALGRKVPEDLSIVGIDNDPLVAALAPLPISSVMQGTHEIGRMAAESLLACLRGKASLPVRRAIPPSGINPAATSPKACPALRDALEFIAANATQGIKAEQVADYLGMSRTTLERLFSDHLGYSAHEELLRTRLSLAQQLLLSGTMSTAEVARRSGFRTQPYMHVVFKRELGLSPKEFLHKCNSHSEE